jgi:hypothetical protein
MTVMVSLCFRWPKETAPKGMAEDKGMLPSYVALTALTDRIRGDELAAVAAALQTQVTRDFAPAWGAPAVVAAVAFEAIPAGYIPLIVQDTMEAVGVNGFHRTRGDDAPYIVVPYGPSWSLSASHELLRMLADPSGSARRSGPSCMPGQGSVEYLIDVCAPCQDVSAAYAIDGIPVSDFCISAFFGPSDQGGSFTGSVRKPFEPAANGTVTWLADDTLLYQARADRQGRIRVHGGFSPANRARMLLRELVDMLTPDRLALLSNAPRTGRLIEAEQNARRMRFANMTRFQDDIAWRFGHASTDPAETVAVAPREVRRAKIQPAAGAKSGHRQTAYVAESRVRTAS